MLAPDRRLLCAGSLATVALGLLLCAQLYWPNLCADALRAPGLRGVARAERDREEQLCRALASVGRSLRGKEEVARDLAEGRLTLLQAAARCRDLDRRKPDFYWDGFRRGMPGRTDEERHCHEAIGQIRATCPLGRTASEEVARRLEAELQVLLDRDQLRLTDAADSGG
jgi:hypothetical protein